MNKINLIHGTYFTNMGEYFKIINLDGHEIINKKFLFDFYSKLLGKANVVVVSSLETNIRDELKNVTGFINKKEITKEFEFNTNYYKLQHLESQDNEIFYFKIYDGDIDNFLLYLQDILPKESYVYYIISDNKKCKCCE